MNVFADTSGFFALMVQNDLMHIRARQDFESLAEHNAQLVTSSFVLVETMTLLQRRIGLQCADDFHLRIFPLLEVVWVDEKWYTRAIQRMLARKQRDVSLVDCLSFEIMESMEIRQAFAFDRHFEETGFSLDPFNAQADR
jgi:predicted nucleic acid-binding protein